MKKTIIAASLLSIIAISCNDSEPKKEQTTPAVDASKTETTSTTAETSATTVVLDSATIMKNWMAYSTPGDMHTMMKSWDGTWDAEITMWHAPGAPPETTKGKTTNKTIMDGRYQISNHSASMMGMPFEGMATLAYDNAKKKFISTWIDNMGTGIMNMEGNWDDASKSLTLTGKSIDPSAGTDKTMDMKEVFKIIDDKHQLMEMYGPGPDGKEFKRMESKDTRK